MQISSYKFQNIVHININNNGYKRYLKIGGIKYFYSKNALFNINSDFSIVKNIKL